MVCALQLQHKEEMQMMIEKSHSLECDHSIYSQAEFIYSCLTDIPMVCALQLQHKEEMQMIIEKSHSLECDHDI